MNKMIAVVFKKLHEIDEESFAKSSEEVAGSNRPGNKRALCTGNGKLLCIFVKCFVLTEYLYRRRQSASHLVTFQPQLYSL